MLLETLDILGFLCGISGAILVTKKNKWGFIAFIISSFIYSYLGVVKSMPGLTMSSICFIVIDIYGFWNWTKMEQKDLTSGEK